MKNEKKVTKTTKPVAKKTAEKKPAAKKTTEKKAETKKTTVKKAETKKPAAKKSVIITDDMISKRAYEIYLESGCIDGRDVENWNQAINELTKSGKKN